MAKFSKFSQCGGVLCPGEESGAPARPATARHCQACQGYPSATHWLESGSCSPRPLYSVHMIVRCTLACTINVRVQHEAEMKCFSKTQSPPQNCLKVARGSVDFLVVLAGCLETSIENKPPSFVTTSSDETEGL